MGRHMLKYHIGLPLAAFAVLVLVGVPPSNAVRLGIAIGCVSMVVMMLTGGHQHRRPEPSEAAARDTARINLPQPPRSDAPSRHER